ncbi:hypothetical protein PMI42_00724 [Bradyrhizobium sp. YR681]|uniref:hypothetical protein n=1 Tax=Bradyrhizobium sp. YR681 TaxID=1144344 RepID=UPI000270E690|nr:hypothetical protein [Bradyrhizobium sp. YR681]EJN15706.1 hypothetical protein PMI42_00724 [Bradyrhizobium sp. YR681]
MTTAKRRARRIAADEAHAWARNLKLRNLQASILLRSLSLYVDGDGIAFAAIPTLAEDCDGLSIDTVRRRLVWLEQVGAIARQPQWLDENGVRNGNGRGKRTTDQIRLLFDADPEMIEARAQGRAPHVDADENAAETTVISPSSVLGLNSGSALGQPSVSPSSTCDHLTSEPEPESPPKTPSGGEGDEMRVLEDGPEPEDFAPAWQSWPGRETQGHRRAASLAEFRQLSPDKQRLCRAAVPLFAQALTRAGRTKPPNFDRWIRYRGFDEFPHAKLGEDVPKPPERRFVQGAELDGLKIASLIAERRDLPTTHDSGLGEGVWRTFPVQPDLVALAACGLPTEAWQVVDLGTEQFAAWRDRLRLWLGAAPRPERIWLEPHDPAVHGLPITHPGFRLRKSKEGFRVPAPWPPRRNGTWYGGGSQDDASQAGGDE